MIGKINRRIEQRVNGIADDLVDHAAMSNNDRGCLLEVLVEHCNELFRISSVSQGGKALYVSEQRRDLTALSAQLHQLRMLDDPPHNSRCEVLLKTAADERFASPDDRIGGYCCSNEHQCRGC